MKEAARYSELLILERARKIKDLRCQVKFELHPQITTAHGVVISKKSYIADFVYFDNVIDREVIEDVKGVVTKEFEWKWKNMQRRYPQFKYLIT